MVHAHKRGFTLLELSIVLTIIGLIIGGVLTGQALIQQARLNKVMTDIQKFVTAFQTFQNKFNALPGDMPNATKYWGAAGTPTNTYAGCYSIAGTGTQTCDGDGNGVISVSGSGPYYYAEEYRAWQHLQLAGLIEGSYSGVNADAAGTAPGPAFGNNVPKSPWNNSGYEIVLLGNYTSATSPYTSFPPINYGHVIMFGTTYGNNLPLYAFLSAADTLSIDSKYDDGLPYSGIISVPSSANGASYDINCTTTATAAAVYNISYSGAACSLIYVTGF